MGFADVSILIERTALRRSYEGNIATSGSYAIYENFQLMREIVPSPVADAMFLLVVVAKFNKDEVAVMHGCKYLFQSQLSEERSTGETAFCMIAYSYAITEPSGNELSPGRIRFRFLINNGRITNQEKRFRRGIWFYSYLFNGRSVACKFKGEAVIPVEIGVFPRFKTDFTLIIDSW